MKNIKYLSVLIFVLLFGCGVDPLLDNIKGRDDNNKPYKIKDIYPLSAKIGDTITITGTNLKNLDNFNILHENSAYYSIATNFSTFITKTNNEITFKVRRVYHENIILQFYNNENYNLEIVGLIPLSLDYRFTSNIKQIKLIDDETAFAISNGKIYKSIDGFYTWEEIYEDPDGRDINSFYYLDTNNCWITIGNSIYSSNDGGNSFNFLIESNSQITKIQFLSSSKGFFVDYNHKMYVIENNSYENIYDYYPNLSSLPFGRIGLSYFNAISDNLIFLSSGSNRNLIKIENQNITAYEFDFWPSSPMFFENIGYLQVNSDIYKTNNLGDSWTKIKTFENHTPELYFYNDQEGFAFVNYSPPEWHFTQDGGTTWEKNPILPNAYFKDFTETNGLMGGNGKFWKYRKE